MNDETVYIGDNIEDDEMENTKELAEKREKALAFWKARLKRSAMAAEFRDSCALSRCSFLENDNVDRREQYRMQIERACGVNSKNAIAINRGIGTAVFETQGHASKNARHISSADRPIRLNQRASGNWQTQSLPCVSGGHPMSELERRRCLERKLLHKQSSTSIGQWAFASEQNIASQHGADKRPALTTLKGNNHQDASSMSLGPTCILPRKRPAAPGNTENAVGINRKKKAKPTKPATPFAQGLLDILGARPESGDC
jgi:hypothetical protein